MGSFDWRDGGHRHGLILQLGEHDLNRVGNCWLKGRLKVGDLIVCIQHSGDCFWTYALLEHDFLITPTCEHCGERSSKFVRGVRLIPESRFGAYVLGTPYKVQLTERQLLDLFAGKDVPFEPLPSTDPPAPEKIDTP